MPLGRATLHAALGHASDETITATLAAYGASAVSGTRPPCAACTVSDMPRALTASVSRMQPLPGSIFRRWQLGLVDPVTPASSLGARYLFHAFQPDSELEWGAAIRAKDDSTTRPPLRVRITPRSTRVGSLRWFTNPTLVASSAAMRGTRL